MSDGLGRPGVVSALAARLIYQSNAVHTGPQPPSRCFADAKWAEIAADRRSSVLAARGAPLDGSGSLGELVAARAARGQARPNEGPPHEWRVVVVFVQLIAASRATTLNVLCGAGPGRCFPSNRTHLMTVNRPLTVAEVTGR
jgi:hypothetical protein